MNIPRIFCLNASGLLLVTSWWIPQVTLWTTLDDSVFWFFNHFITLDNPHWDTVLAALNSRRFDLAIIAGMLAIMLWACLRDQQRGWQRWVGIGMTMLITAGLMNEIVRHLPIHHPSPTRFFPEASLVSDFVHFATKDSAGNSFPGDHGIMAMIFAGFMLSFGDRVTRLASIGLVTCAIAPRIMVGAHWLSDVMVGSLSLALLLLPWVLCTPLASRTSRWISAGLTRWMSPEKGDVS
ncbi:phosphatase PAP2 family protein [Larsenimonas rhizosphaerae]|uniref:phosphatase PAP2 family protein n=1 Tax=Larsenimonas rhizosphaerae TaxID=2944682 RepID=UPI0020346389|nr:phosphatase PAP2 family protein [Larsenimonas rhizosphaerae]MCM2129856.1 phosphatase PAP2 family protein [Larsenimonas rhizosphaerae]